MYIHIYIYIYSLDAWLVNVHSACAPLRQPQIVHCEYMALAKDTSVLREAMLFYVCFLFCLLTSAKCCK